VPESRFSELSLSAQTAYAELFEQTRAFEIDNALSGLSGSFHTLKRKGNTYWYFSYRDPGSARPQVLYVGPDNEQVKSLVERFRKGRSPRALSPQALAAITLGCVAVAPKHFRVIKRLAEYGMFRAGGVLVGTHAFLALGNLLGVRWAEASTTLDVDIAHPGRNVSVGLPADLEVNTHGALQSLEMGLLPMSELDGGIGAQYRNPADQELRVDFLTVLSRSRKPVEIPALNVALEPLKFMEYLLESPVQGVLIGRAGACIVNLPAPERYATHKLVVYGERPASQRTRARKDLLQAAAIASWFRQSDQAGVFSKAWRDLVSRGPGWQRRAKQGHRALIEYAPDLDDKSLWRM
jgi:hypothetical protein